MLSSPLYALLAVAGLALAPATAAETAGPSLATTSDCATIDGLEPLLRSKTVLVLGEMHGSRESPAFFGEVACRALAAGRSVTAALELLDTETPGVERYLASAGTETDRAALTAAGTWSLDYQDGRTSAAMADLLERLRGFRADGQEVAIELFDRRGWKSGQERDRLMAEALSSILRATASDLVLVLTGNIHSRAVRGTPWDASYEPMTHLLEVPSDWKLVSLNVAHAGGTSWMCNGSTASTCGVREVSGRETNTARSIELGDDPAATGHHGRYVVGTLSASPPAARGLGDRP